MRLVIVCCTTMLDFVSSLHRNLVWTRLQGLLYMNHPLTDRIFLSILICSFLNNMIFTLYSSSCLFNRFDWFIFWRFCIHPEWLPRLDQLVNWFIIIVHLWYHLGRFFEYQIWCSIIFNEISTLSLNLNRTTILPLQLLYLWLRSMFFTARCNCNVPTNLGNHVA